MQKQNETQLRKKLLGDTIGTVIVTALSVLVGAYWIYMVFSTAYPAGMAEAMQRTQTLIFLTNGITYLLIGAALVFLCLALFEIRRTGKPFSKSIIRDIRIMAWLLVADAISPVIPMLVAFFTSVDNTGRATFVHFNLFTFIFAVILLIISEIFSYGYALQEDVDSIA